jgi:hypothetical protein
LAEARQRVRAILQSTLDTGMRIRAVGAFPATPAWQEAVVGDDAFEDA